MHFSIDRTVHTTAFDKPVVDHWLEWKITQTAAGSTEKDRSDDRPLQRRARYRLSYIPLSQHSVNGLVLRFTNINHVSLETCYTGCPLLVCQITWQEISTGRKERNVLFNDALNTFLFTVIWRQTYG